MSKPLVSELSVGDRVAAPFVVTDISLAPFRSKPGSYLNLTLKDRSGEITARMWDNAEQAAAALLPGQVAMVAGHVEEYQGEPQVIVRAIRPCRPDEYDPADFVASSQRNPEEMLAQLQANIAEVSNPHLHKLLVGVTIMTVPLMIGPGELIGLAVLYRKGEQPFTEDDVRMAELIAPATAAAVRNL